MDEEVVEEGEVNKEIARFELYLKTYFNMQAGKLCMIRNALWSYNCAFPYRTALLTAIIEAKHTVYFC